MIIEMILGFGLNKMGNIKEAIEDKLRDGKVYECSRCKDLVLRIRRIDELILCEDCYSDLVYDYAMERDYDTDEEGDRV